MQNDIYDILNISFRHADESFSTPADIAFPRTWPSWIIEGPKGFKGAEIVLEWAKENSFNVFTISSNSFKLGREEFEAISRTPKSILLLNDYNRIPARIRAKYTDIYNTHRFSDNKGSFSLSYGEGDVSPLTGKTIGDNAEDYVGLWMVIAISNPARLDSSLEPYGNKELTSFGVLEITPEDINTINI